MRVLGGAVGVADGYSKKEPVELVFGEIVGAFEFDGGFGWPTTMKGRARAKVWFSMLICSSLMASRRADWVRGSCAVDFVGQDDVGEDRAGFEVEGLRCQIENGDA